jgi:hypothetical protein
MRARHKHRSRGQEVGGEFEGIVKDKWEDAEFVNAVRAGASILSEKY